MAWECLCGVSNSDSKNTCNACGTPKGMVWTPEGFRTADDAETTAPVTPAPASPKAIKIAWVLALVWGGLTVGVAALSPFLHTLGLTALTQSAGQGLVGIFYLSLGLAVRRGDRFSIWCLVVLQALEVGLYIFIIGTRGILLPIILLILFIRGALHLQRTDAPIVDSENWTHVLYEVAFLQATLTAMLVAWAFVVDPTTLAALGGRSITVLHSLDVIILVGFGIAAWKRQVWAGYALMLYQLSNVSLVMMTNLNPLIPVGIAFLYAFGAFHLHRLRGPMTGWGRAAVALVAVLVLVSVVSLRLKREATIQTITEEGKIESIMQQFSSYQVLKESDPQAYESIKAIVRHEMGKGQDYEVVVARVRSTIAQVLNKYIPHASDNAVIAMTALLIRRIEELTQISPDLCFQYLFPGEYGVSGLLKHMSDKGMQEEDKVMAAIIRTATVNPQPSPDVVQAEALAMPVYTKVYEKYGDAFLLFVENPLDKNIDKGDACIMTAALYEEMLSIPKKDSGKVLRYILSSQ